MHCERNASPARFGSEGHERIARQCIVHLDEVDTLSLQGSNRLARVGFAGDRAVGFDTNTRDRGAQQSVRIARPRPVT